ncbi:hypothetical protein FOIG_16874 [Fusarium odoratissimum NRRL 54006]|uniref:Uncharacterized protein n=2 Tax=Fusarium oxysporum species complex TaxID=171631 RepID=X0ILY4_FUSO5|nr:uncharacterized protein FOIG_16874 [Fusarium odoratissimum NRRL 54006]EXL89842.1 hypothetical protein FOIG_16874 [Fusarium odoratissimum NRRL 54006]TXB97954.1 hypothetical protein FocTR4_00016913 [Fusarium oxysporum f. sp. cubense]
MSQSATWDGVNKKHRHYVLNFLVSLASRTVATRRPRRLAGLAGRFVSRSGGALLGNFPGCDTSHADQSDPC